MGLGSSLSGVTFSGIGSGIDTESIISRLMALEQIPINRLQVQRQQLEGKKAAMAAFKERVSALSSAGAALNSATAFNPVSATSSNAATATVTATSGALSGTYNLAVSKLAQSHKIASSAQADLTTALNLSGRLMVNGRMVAVEVTDSLTSISQKINGSQSGVTASVINGGAGQAYLTLTSTTSGANGKIQISNLSGTVATALGFTTGAAAIREPVTNGAASSTFSASTTAIGTLLGVTDLTSTTVTINGTGISLNLQTQSLQDIANTISSSAAGVTASVKSVTENGTTRHRLEITGAGTPTFVDPNGTLEAIGILQKGFSSQLLAAQNAAFTIDGMSFSTASNAVSTVIPGVTLTLLKANEAAPETSTIVLSQDNTAVKGKIKDFMATFNNLVDFVKVNSALDKESFDSGLLFGDSTVQSVESSLSQTLFNTVQGLATAYTNLGQVGFTFDSDSKLKLDESILDTALSANPTAVGNIFRTTGIGSAESLQFVSNTTKTKTTGLGSYSVSISQLATKGFHSAAIAQSAVNSTTETLKFNGALLGNAEYNLTIPAGNSLQSTIDLINNDSKLKDLVVATNSGGSLKIESKKFGTNGNFTVWSNLDAAADNSGIGTDGGIIGSPVHYVGLNTEGTINGETATGSGQFLTGNVGNANTEGLQILYSGSTTGVAGTIKFSRGVAASIQDLVTQYTDGVSGLLTANDNSLQAQIKSIDDTIESIQTRSVSKQQELRRRFSVMEAAISRFQQQAGQLSAISANIAK